MLRNRFFVRYIFLLIFVTSGRFSENSIVLEHWFAVQRYEILDFLYCVSHETTYSR